MQALHEDAEADGAYIMFKSRVLGADVTGGIAWGWQHLAPVCLLRRSTQPWHHVLFGSVQAKGRQCTLRT